MFLIRVSNFLLLLLIGNSSAQKTDFCAETAYSNICVKLGEKFYLIDGNAKLNWYDAERFCRRQSGFLVTIENASELKLISDYLVSQNYLNGDHWFWTGVNDLGSEGIFYYVETGNLPFTEWTGGQPDNAGGHENCVHLWKSGQNAFAMNDVGCERKIHFICEVKEKHIPIINPRWRRSN